MSYHRRGRKLGREVKKRQALLRSLALSLIRHGRIKTTTARAKELRPWLERLITRAKDKGLVNRRLVLARLGSVSGTRTIFDQLAPRYLNRPGGYTRIIKLPQRRGDKSPVAIIEFV